MLRKIRDAPKNKYKKVKLDIQCKQTDFANAQGTNLGKQIPQTITKKSSNHFQLKIQPHQARESRSSTTD